jgi:hypothetical protein
VTRNESCSSTEPSADPNGVERLLSASVQRAVAARPRNCKVDTAVGELWDDSMIVETEADLAHELKKPKFARVLGDFDRAEILRAIAARRTGYTLDKPVKQVEFDAILAAPEGFGDDVPIDPNFHARRLADSLWRKSNSSDGVERVVQMHRLREVIALAGFTRLEPVMPDIYGEYAKDAETAPRSTSNPVGIPPSRTAAKACSSNCGTTPCRSGPNDRRSKNVSRNSARVTRRGRRIGSRSATSPGTVHPAAHAFALADSVGLDALRLSGDVDPRAHLRRLCGQAGSDSCCTPRHRTPRGHSAAWCRPRGSSRITSSKRSAWRRCARTIRSARSTHRPRAWRAAGSTAPRATAAR